EAFVALEEVVLIARSAPAGVRPVKVGAHEVAVGRDATDRVAGRENAGGANLVHAAPEVEVLERPARKVLALRDAHGCPVPLHEDAIDIALPKLHREGEPDRTATHDRDLVLSFHLLIARHRLACVLSSFLPCPSRN